MKLGTELLLKSDSFCSKKGDKLLYLRHCTDSGFSCVEAVVMDSQYYLILKEWGCYTLEQAYESFIKGNIMPMDLNQFALRFTTIKPKVDQVCIKEDLILEKERLEKRLNKINSLIELGGYAESN